MLTSAAGGRIALEPEGLLRLAAGCGEASAEIRTIRLQAEALAGSVGEPLTLSCELAVTEQWLQDWAVEIMRRIRFLAGDGAAAWALTGIGLVKAVDQVTHGRAAWALNRKLTAAWELYNDAIKTGEFGHHADLRSLNRWFAWQETVSGWGLPIDWARAATHMGDNAIELGRDVKFGKTALRWSDASQGTRILRSTRSARWMSRALGPIGYVSDAWVVWKGSDYEGTRGTVDRVVSGFSLLGGAAAVGATALGLAAAPAVVTVAGAVALGAGVWAVGNMAWDNRDDIANAVTSAADWTGDRVEDAGEAIEDAAGAVAEGAGDAVESVADAVTFWD